MNQLCTPAVVIVAVIGAHTVVAAADEPAASSTTTRNANPSLNELVPSLAIDSATYPYRSDGSLQIDAGLQIGFPTALTTGLSKGIGAGVTFGSCPLRWGVRAAWVSTTESTLTWQVTHSDLHLRVTGSAQHALGRGVVALRLGAGPTLIHETRVRNQGARAGLTGDALENTTWRLAPALDLEAVMTLHIAGDWALLMTGGPSIALVDKLHGSWNAGLGVAWAY